MKKILYIDDDADIRELVALSLELEASFLIKTARSGCTGLDIAREFLPDLILLDVMMPEMDGPTTLAIAQSDPKLLMTPVVFITSRSQPHQVSYLLSLGALGVIPKPFDPLTLSEQVLQYMLGSGPIDRLEAGLPV